MGRAIGISMIVLGLIGLSISFVDRSRIEVLWASWTNEPVVTAEEERTSAAKAMEAEVNSPQPADQSQTAAVTELETGNVNVFERGTEASPDTLPWVDVEPGNDLAREDSGHINFVLTLSKPVERPIIIIFTTVDGSARSDEDYLSQRGTVTFKPGVVSAEIRTPLVDDQVKEGDEQFALILNGSPGIVNLRSRRATATIEDND